MAYPNLKQSVWLAVLLWLIKHVGLTSLLFLLGTILDHALHFNNWRIPSCHWSVSFW